VKINLKILTLKPDAMTKEKTHETTSEDSETSKFHELVVHNDDFNTFDFVIKTLIEVCRHSPEQAEQCTFIIHYKGRCTVMTDDYDTLRPMYTEILNRGITATIE
jgi:ATP-dependent Clp protease adaptor protein ClpS